MSAAAVDSPRAWVVAVGCALANGVAFGTLYTFGAFVESMADEFDAGLGPTSIVFGITMFLFFGTGALSGRWSDRYGPRPLLVIGGILFCGGLVATSYVTAIWQGYLVYGIGAGFGGGLFSAPLFAVLAAWFVRFRAMAQGVGATGPGLGTLFLVPFAKSLIDTQGWRESYRILAVICGAAFIIALMLVERPPVTATGDASRHVRAVVRTTAFRQLAVASCLMSTALIGAFAFVITFAEADGISSSRAALLVGIIGASSIIGRLALTGLAGSLGSVRLLQMCFAVQPFAYLAWMFAGGRYPMLVLFAVLLGVSYGGYVALMGDVTAHLFGLVGIGAVLGALYLSSGVGSLIGPPLAGFLADATSGRAIPLTVVFVLATLGALLLTRLSPEPVDVDTRDPRGIAIDNVQGVRTRLISSRPEAAPQESGHRLGAS